jgi:F0F1-type ATP synthase assembly protein I
VSDSVGSGPSNASDQEKSELRNLPGPVAFAAMGTTLASCLAVGVVLGLYIDHLWNLAPVGLLIGIALGTVAAVASVVKLVRRYL